MRSRLASCLALLALPFAVALPGCSEEEASNALADALGYVPADTPFVAVIDTDLKGSQYKALGRIVRRFPFGDQAEESLKQQLERGDDVDFDRDVKPLLGNPFVVAAADARSFAQEGETNDFVAALQVEDGGKLDDLVEREDPKELGEKSGATLYQDEDGDVFAVEDDVLVVGGSRQLVEAAVERRNGDDKLDEDQFNQALEGLPRNALVRAFFDIERLLQVDPDARDARKVKWVDALRTLGLTASVEGDAIAIDFRMKTDGAGLSVEDLPLAAGDEAPRIVRKRNELAIGLRDPGQIVDFALAAGQAVRPGQVEAGKRQIERRLGIDVEKDLIRQLGGDVSLNLAVNGDFGLRAELRDPRAFERTLAKIAKSLPRVAEGLGAGPVGLAKRGDFYALAQPDGRSVLFGVVGDVLVASNSASRAGRLASERASGVPNAKGSVVISADAEQLADAALERLGPQLGLGAALGGRLFTGPLGDLSGSVATETGGLRGSLTLGFD